MDEKSTVNDTVRLLLISTLFELIILLPPNRPVPLSTSSTYRGSSSTSSSRTLGTMAYPTHRPAKTSSSYGFDIVGSDSTSAPSITLNAYAKRFLFFIVA
jgi:hypothetical protein